jgi:DNA polymerase III alpha subunit
MTNVIVRPDVYDRFRAAIRGEPFLLVTGKLAKDDGTVNVLAEEVTGLEMRRNGRTSTNLDNLHPPPMQFLRSMRRVAPDSKDWG